MELLHLDTQLLLKQPGVCRRPRPVLRCRRPRRGLSPPLPAAAGGHLNASGSKGRARGSHLHALVTSDVGHPLI